MAIIKIPVTPNNERALIDLLVEPIIEDNKCIVEYDSSKIGDTFVIKVGENISGECTIGVEKAINPDTGEEFTLLKEYTYSFELNDGATFELKSTYLYSIGNMVTRMFYKVLAKAKSQYPPIRSNIKSINRAKLKEERDKYNEAKKIKPITEAEAEVIEVTVIDAVVVEPEEIAPEVTAPTVEDVESNDDF